MISTLLYSVCTLGIIGLTTMAFAAFSAPQGVEDEHGFHLAEPLKVQPEKSEEFLSTSDLSFFA